MAIVAGTSIGKPRIFIDYVSYLSAVGGVTGYSGSPDLWDMNPSKVTETPLSNSCSDSENCLSDYYSVIFDSGYEIDNFLSTTNYFAALGHNTNGSHYRIDRSTDVTFAAYSHTNYAPGAGNAYELPGYKIDTLSHPFTSPYYGTENVYSAYLYTTQNPTNPSVGSFSAGRYFDFPHSTDLNVSFVLSHEGIKTKRTIGGRDITNINYHSQPLWGDRKPWTSGETYKYTGYNGRRSWRVSFSYIDHDDALPKDTNEDFMLDYTVGHPDLGVAHATENIVSHFLSLTLNGSLKFIFQPDVTLDQFALCRLSKTQTTFKQVAHKTYDVSFTFVETY